jgi:predicted nuclease with RNAse H fold
LTPAYDVGRSIGEGGKVRCRMRTLGVDLASQAATTAACTIEWASGTGRVVLVQVGVDDQAVLSLASQSDVIGIDAPFGWPVPFVDMIRLHHDARGVVEDWSTRRRDALRFRATDMHVRDLLGRWPLSVSSDLIAITAMRCAGLLDRLGVVDRSGDGRVFEVYPALALGRWGFASRGYKAAKNIKRLSSLVIEVRHACPWLVMPDSIAMLCARSDHAFDALIASLVARAGGVGLTERPSAAEAHRARIEGWIAVPYDGSLVRLPYPVLAAS